MIERAEKSGRVKKIAVVTGGARGIGRAVALRLAADGMAVAVWDLDEKGAQETADLIDKADGQAVACVGDASTESGITAALQQTHTALGFVTVLINNAAIADVVPFMKLKSEHLDRTLSVNLRGPILLTQAVLPDMIAAGWGRIVNVTSSSAQSGTAGMAHYATSKGGLMALTKSLALEFAENGITVNHVPPSFIATPMSSRSAEETERVARQFPMKRQGTPEEVAAACAFLATDEASYITGQALSVNGGRYTC